MEKSIARSVWLVWVTRSDLEAHFNYSGDNLYKIIRNYTGLSIHDYGAYLCMKRAAELLLSSDRNINEIAEAVGFHNFTQFYKEFKKHYNMTPKEYRKLYFDSLRNSNGDTPYSSANTRANFP